jgi:hypothetical protein
LIRQMPPSRAATMRHNPGQAEGRGVMLGAGPASKGHPAIVKVRFSVEGAVLCLLCPAA